MFKKAFFLSLIFCTNLYMYASVEKYSISVCTTSNLENAQTCKKRILKNMQSDVYIVKELNGKYITYLGIFDNKNEAKNTLNKASTYVKNQKAFIKVVSNDIAVSNNENKSYVDKINIEDEKKVVEKVSLKEEVIAPKEEFKLVSVLPNEEKIELVKIYPFSQGEILEDDVPVSLNEIVSQSKIEEIPKDNLDTNIKNISEQNELKYGDEIIEIKKKVSENSISDLTIYEQILIEVDSSSNFMTVKAKIDNEFKDIKIYKVSTGKEEIKKPFGMGKVSQISLNPIWYPTQDTIKSFKKRGIKLPSAVPAGHKLNYMGAAKINLTHIVDGKNTFRIHGTLNENTIGTKESSGCIRMKNNDVVQLAILLNKFASIKSLDEVKVILK